MNVKTPIRAKIKAYKLEHPATLQDKTKMQNEPITPIKASLNLKAR